MSEIKQVRLELIDPNPYRDLATYPWIEGKVAHLMRSIQDVGFWESVIARAVPTSSRFEIAFGHHRTEAARRLKLKTLPLILRSLNDLDMLRFMGRENDEDYRSDFQSMMNTWEGAVRYGGIMIPPISKHIEIANLLGWTHPHSSGKGWQMSATAAACAAAYDLVRDNHISRDDLRGLTTREARELVVVAHKEIENLAIFGAREKRDHKVTKAAQRVVSRSAKFTAEDVRAGKVAQNDIRNEVRMNIIRHVHTGGKKPKLLPLFAHFGAALCQKIDHMLTTDRSGKHIDEIAKVINDITLDEDLTVVRNLHHSLDELALRAERAKRRTTPNKVVKLTAIKGDAS
jgi:ParB/RepB/Spo0J family partition protein